MRRVKAKCLITYPSEDDMLSFSHGKIEACDVKIFHKGREYFVVQKFHDKDYFEVLKPIVYE